jgi:purine-nucleoside/S-methyl-5'-thioadenosine phosphorylase / adenosine deaminase
MTSSEWIIPRWPATERVRAVSTTRHGGTSRPPYDALNLAEHVGDEAVAVAANRVQLRQALQLPAMPAWLQQVHGVRVVNAAGVTAPVAADAAYALEPGVVCAVLTADCLPVLLCDRGGHAVAAAHAGWRGLAAGVIEQTIAAMPAPGGELMAWLGPAISAAAYVVGEEVRDTFMSHDPMAETAFRPAADGRWHADLYRLARQRLQSQGVAAIHGGGFCTWQDPVRFYSYRRDGVTGRMASLIWLQDI